MLSPMAFELKLLSKWSCTAFRKIFGFLALLAQEYGWPGGSHHSYPVRGSDAQPGCPGLVSDTSHSKVGLPGHALAQVWGPKKIQLLLSFPS